MNLQRYICYYKVHLHRSRMEERQSLARGLLAKCPQNNAACMCTLVHVCLVWSSNYMERRLTTVRAHMCSCSVNKGQMLPLGKNFKYTTCAKNVYMKNSPRANGMLSKAHIMHACTQGVKNSRTHRQRDGQINKERMRYRNKRRLCSR